MKEIDQIVFRPGNNIVILEGAAQGYCLVCRDGCHRRQRCEAEEGGQEGGQDAAGPPHCDDTEEAEQDVGSSQGDVKEA